MSTVTNNLLRTAALVFAIAGSAAAMAQTTSPAANNTSTGAATTSATSATKTATGTAAAQTAVAATTVAASKAQQPTGLTRAQVQAEFLEARKNGTLLQTEADFDVAQTRKHVAN
nr:DUF4148 domain-containing protein [uncultured Duganella sp.]